MAYHIWVRLKLINSQSKTWKLAKSDFAAFKATLNLPVSYLVLLNCWAQESHTEKKPLCSFALWGGKSNIIYVCMYVCEYVGVP